MSRDDERHLHAVALLAQVTQDRLRQARKLRDHGGRPLQRLGLLRRVHGAVRALKALVTCTPCQHQLASTDVTGESREEAYAACSSAEQ